LIICLIGFFELSIYSALNLKYLDTFLDIFAVLIIGTFTMLLSIYWLYKLIFGIWTNKSMKFESINIFINKYSMIWQIFRKIAVCLILVFVYT